MGEDYEFIFETEHWAVNLGSDQLYLGRSYVTLKRPCGDLADITKEEMLDFLEVVKKLENVFRKTFDATMFNWTCLMNNAYQEENPQPQVHWHFRPRYSHSVELSGKVYKDPNFGHHYLRGKENEDNVSNEVLKIINTKLQQNL